METSDYIVWGVVAFLLFSIVYTIWLFLRWIWRGLFGRRRSELADWDPPVLEPESRTFQDIFAQWDPTLKETSTKPRHIYLIRTFHDSFVAKEGDPVMFLLEPDNPVDKNAIGVVLDDRATFVGYIAKEDNSSLANYLKNEGKYYAEIDWVGDSGDRYMVMVWLTKKIKARRHSSSFNDLLVRLL